MQMILCRDKKKNVNIQRKRERLEKRSKYISKGIIFQTTPEMLTHMERKSKDSCDSGHE